MNDQLLLDDESQPWSIASEANSDGPGGAVRVAEEVISRFAEEILREEHPSATYRLQFNPQFTFRDATGIVEYLRELGISHIYASPYLKARRGSVHGYDIVD